MSTPFFPEFLDPPKPEPAPTPAEPVVLTVSQLTAQIKDLMESAFPAVWVAGEVSNFARPQSGHCYLTLKDDQAQIRAALWRNVANRLRFDLGDGLEVICQGHLDVYAARGSYQLIIDQIEPRGIGALELALRQLREKLAKEGLFRPEHKRPLPPFVRRVAIVTSPTGAAIHDFLQVLGRRWRGTDVLVVPSRVQGDGAAEEIATAIARANRLPLEIDCLVVARGGGSLEDLWAFNEEVVVRAIYNSRIPVVSAIGHEIDVTLADLVADVRALTPSEAAELVAPAADEFSLRLRQMQRRLASALRGRLATARARLDSVGRQRAFRRPLDRVQELSRRLDDLDTRTARAVRQRLTQSRSRLAETAARLSALSPLAVLGRGFSLTQRESDGRIVRSADELEDGDVLLTRFSTGRARSRVEKMTQ